MQEQIREFLKTKGVTTAVGAVVISVVSGVAYVLVKWVEFSLTSPLNFVYSMILPIAVASSYMVGSFIQSKVMPKVNIRAREED